MTIEFTVNRLSIKLEHRAVTWAGENASLQLEKVLFPTATTFPQFLDPNQVKLGYETYSIHIDYKFIKCKMWRQTFFSFLVSSVERLRVTTSRELQSLI